MCRSLNLHMLNGRYGADNEIGKTTCKNSSTVDYVIFSEKLSEIISDFDILEFDGTLSDIHCPVYAAFKSVPQILAHNEFKNSETVNMCENIKYKWNANFIDVYRTNITKFKNNIEKTIHQAEIKSSLLDDDINNIVNVISDALKKAAYNSGMGKSLKKRN